MEIILVDNYPFIASRFLASDTLLKCSVPSTHNPRIVRENELDADFAEYVTLTATNRKNYCIHVKKNPAYANDYNKCVIRVHGFFLENFEAWMEGLKVRIQLSFSLNASAGNYVHQTYPLQMFAEIPISKSTEPSSMALDLYNETCITNGIFLEATDVSVYNWNNLFNGQLHANPVFNGCATISLVSDSNKMHDSGNDQIAVFNNPSHGITRINRVILDSKVCSDVIITSKDGSEHSCNKPFLAAHSSVLKAMMETDMKEAKTNIIEMKEMTSDGVAALLEYLYTFELDQAIGKCDIALELLEAGHKYDIGTMEKEVSSLILNQDEDWFSVDMAFNLFLFVGKVEFMKEIKMKAATVLMKKPNEFMECKAYKKKREENLEVAADAVQELFCILALK